ncbi:MAG: hypothetical protein WAM60_22940 [Candidatus Promineifilaceae bacterium]
MSFYIFKLDQIRVKQQRGILSDSDVVTFSVFVNQLDRGHGTATFPALVSSPNPTPAEAVPPRNKLNINGQQWRIGPLEILEGDDVHVIYSGMNISDVNLSSLSSKQLDEIELKILSSLGTAAVGGLTGGLGLIGEGIAAALGAIGDPVGKALGYKPQGPCNGLVFSDAVQFTGGGLDNLEMTPLPPQLHTKPPMPRYWTISFTRSYTDEATHDTEKCGPIAETEITFSVLRMSFISVRWLRTNRFIDTSKTPSKIGPGLRQFGQPGTVISLKSLLGLRP